MSYPQIYFEGGGSMINRKKINEIQQLFSLIDDDEMHQKEINGLLDKIIYQKKEKKSINNASQGTSNYSYL